MTASLTVNRKDLDPALKLIRKLCKPRKTEEAVLSFDGECLHIELGGMAVAPAASGDWQGQARVPGSFVLMLAKIPPEGDPINISVDAGQLRVATSSSPCVWEPGWIRTISLPEQPSHRDILVLPYQHELSEIETSGYGRMLREAQEWRNQRIEQAMKVLSDFGVTRKDIELIITNSLRRVSSK